MAPFIVGVTDHFACPIRRPHKIAVSVIQHGGALPVGINDSDGTAPPITDPGIAMMTLPVIGNRHPTR